ncbi:MAG: 6-hydroxymethylpterin diphosphokinase MptE-like protein [Spirochaetia bacterium]|jgi:hypothetical protein
MPGEDPLLLQTEKGPTLLWRGVYFYPQGDPIEYARRKARVFSPGARSLIFVPSIGLGHGLQDLLLHAPDTCAILCVEAFQEVMGIAMTRGLPRDPRLTIIRTEDPDAVAAALRNMGMGRFRRVIAMPLCAGYRLAPGLYERFQRRLEQEVMRYWQNRLTLIAMGSLQVRNILYNLPLLSHALDLSALSTGLPVVVAGAGPSLEQSISALSQLRDRYLLVAVDTALPCLLASGMAPDIIIALEAQVANIQDFISGRSQGSLVACDLSSHPSAARLFPGRLCFFSSTFAPLQIFDRLARRGLLPMVFPALGSVGVAAAHAALCLTQGDVYLTGLDFSFPGWRTHARGSPNHLAMMMRASRMAPVGQAGFQAVMARSLLRVSDKNGALIITDRVLQSYRDSLEQEMRPASDRVRDCGLFGLPLGVRRISTREMVERLGSIVPQARGLDIDPMRRFPADMLPGFFAAEKVLLSRAMELPNTPASDSAEAAEAKALLRAIDYAWVHFPDEPDWDAPDAGFLARVRVAAAYYFQRIARIASVL